MLKQVLT